MTPPPRIRLGTHSSKAMPSAYQPNLFPRPAHPGFGLGIGVCPRVPADAAEVTVPRPFSLVSRSWPSLPPIPSPQNVAMAAVMIGASPAATYRSTKHRNGATPSR